MASLLFSALLLRYNIIISGGASNNAAIALSRNASCRRPACISVACSCSLHTLRLGCPTRSPGRKFCGRFQIRRCASSWNRLACYYCC